MGTKRQSRLSDKRAAILMTLALAAVLLASGCRPDRLGTPPPYRFSVEPAWVCPGEEVTVSWTYQSGQQPDSCDGINPRSAPHTQCRTVEITSSPTPLEPRVGPGQIQGERRKAIREDHHFTFQAFEAQPVGSTSPALDSPAEADVHVINAPAEGIPITYHATCRIRNIEYVADQSIKRTVSECVAVEQVCNRSGEALNAVSDEDGTAAILSPDGCTDAFGSVRTDLAIDPVLDPVFDSGLRHPCTPDEELLPGEERAPLPDDITLVLQVTCQIPSGSSDCSASMPIMSEPEGPSDEGIATICNLEETCGDGVCDQPCEDAQFCAEDCQPEGGAPVCGDGTLSPPEEKCEVDEDCEQGYFCGDPGTRAPCLCVSNATEQSGDGPIQYFPVYDCVFVGGDTFQWYGANVTLGPDGEHLTVEYVDGPHQGGWRGFCPAGGEPNKPASEGEAPSCDPQQQQC